MCEIVHIVLLLESHGSVSFDLREAILLASGHWFKCLTPLLSKVGLVELGLSLHVASEVNYSLPCFSTLPLNGKTAGLFSVTIFLIVSPFDLLIHLAHSGVVILSCQLFVSAFSSMVFPITFVPVSYFFPQLFSEPNT